MNLNLKGKNALVCGSSKGIGKAAAIELSKLGANITLVSLSVDLMSNIIHELHTEGEQDHDFLVADFTDRNDLNKKVKGLVSGKTIHVLVNNTGGPPSGPIVDAKAEEFLQAFHNHVLCNHMLAQLVLPGMKKAEFGRIINIISTSVKQPLPNLGVSNTTRGAVASWAKTLSNEVGQFGITVNNVLPGFTETDRLKSIISGKAAKSEKTFAEVETVMKSQVPTGRFADPSEVGMVIAFLASPAAAYINGVSLPVDGGRTGSL